MLSLLAGMEVWLLEDIYRHCLQERNSSRIHLLTLLAGTEVSLWIMTSTSMNQSICLRKRMFAALSATLLETQARWKALQHHFLEIQVRFHDKSKSNYIYHVLPLVFIVGARLVIYHSAVWLLSLITSIAPSLTFSLHFSSSSAFLRSLLTQSYIYLSNFKSDILTHGCNTFYLVVPCSKTT